MNPCIEYIYIKNENTTIIVMLFTIYTVSDLVSKI